MIEPHVALPAIAGMLIAFSRARLPLAASMLAFGLVGAVDGGAGHEAVHAGLGGLACALRLAGAGRRVTVLERGPGPGGRIGQLAVDGYRFDTGPTVLTLPHLLDETLGAVGDLAVHDHTALADLDALADAGTAAQRDQGLENAVGAECTTARDGGTTWQKAQRLDTRETSPLGLAQA